MGQTFRKIIHIDMDCFYAAIEMRDQPELKGRAIAVGGAGKRGVIATCNYLARDFKVRSAMSSQKAKILCPDLIILPPRMEHYRQVSHQFREILQQYTPLIEPLSLDEAYLDVTESTLFTNSASRIAMAIRQQITEELQLTASAGVASTKFIAKIASDINKPNGQFVVPPDQVEQFLLPLTLSKIPGVGRATMDKLKLMQLNTVYDVRQISVTQLKQVFGKFGEILYQRCLGQDDRKIETERERKSISVETTFNQDLDNRQEAEQAIELLYLQLMERLEKHQLQQAITKIGVKLKFTDFSQTTVEQISLGLDKILFVQLLYKGWQRGQGKSIRLLGLSAGVNDHKTDQQIQYELPW